MKKINISAIILFVSFILIFGFGNDSFTEKDWHESPNTDLRSSDIYPYVEWRTVLEIKPGMKAEKVKKMVGFLNCYDHPINAIIYTQNPDDGLKYEVALKLSKDKNIIEDLSFKNQP
jgi:hypothetical protein